MVTKELAKYLELHEITICKTSAEGKLPGIRIGRVWRFHNEAIDRWIAEGTPPVNKASPKEAEKETKKQR